MKKLLIFPQMAFLALLLFSCTPKKDTIGKLPELPQEFAENLEYSKSMPALMTNINIDIPPSKEDTSSFAPVARSCKRKYWVQLTYPITICYPPSELFDKLVANANVSFQTDSASGAGLSQSIPIQKAEFHRLSSYNGVGFRVPFGCRTHGGWWVGMVEEETSCILGAPNSYIFTILSVPETVVIIWHGELSDFPKPASMQLFGDFQLVSEECTCCGGLKQCPNGDCIPINRDCEPGSPV